MMTAMTVEVGATKYEVGLRGQEGFSEEVNK